MKTVLIHGLGQTDKSWDKTIKYMNCFDRCCINLWSIIDSDYNYTNLYRQFEKYCNNLVGKINLCGLSLGAVLALDYSIKNSERVNKLILIGVAYKTPKSLVKIQTILLSLMPRTAFKELNLEKNDFINLCKTTLENKICNEINNLQTPTLILCGNRDYFGKKASNKLCAHISNAVYKVIPNADHTVNESNPKYLAKEIDNYLNNACN